jgi:hypothetical protein
VNSQGLKFVINDVLRFLLLFQPLQNGIVIESGRPPQHHTGHSPLSQPFQAAAAGFELPAKFLCSQQLRHCTSPPFLFLPSLKHGKLSHHNYFFRILSFFVASRRFAERTNLHIGCVRHGLVKPGLTQFNFSGKDCAC